MDLTKNACLASPQVSSRHSLLLYLMRISIETTVADIIAQIEAEDKSVQTVDVRTKRGKSFQPQNTLQQILNDDFELVINDRVLPVTAPVFTGNTYTSLLDDGNLDVRSVAQKLAIISLRHSLETLQKWKISYTVRRSAVISFILRLIE